MMELYADPVTDFPLEVNLSPTDSESQKIPQTVNVRVGGENSRVLLGSPQTTDLSSEQPHLPAENHIREVPAALDYLAVRLACSFVPGRGSLLSWVRLDADLTVPVNVTRDPLVHDLFPRAVSAAVQYSRRFSVSPKFKLAFIEVSAQSESEAEVLEYKPQLDAAGLLTSTPSWTFQSAERAGLRGSYELFAIIEVPKATSVRLRMNVSAEARGRFGPIPLRSAGNSGNPSIEYLLRGSTTH